MAIIKCPECAKTVSDAAPSCPQCGYPIAGPPAQSREANYRTEHKIEETKGAFASSFGETVGAGLGCVLIGIIAAAVLVGGFILLDDYMKQQQKLEQQKEKKQSATPMKLYGELVVTKGA